METPLVSVIVPLYNMEDLIGQTIEWILASTYPNMEVVVVDDGSGDGSVAVVNKYVSQHHSIKLFIQQNKGAAAARNFGIQNAGGKYILPIDSDDMLCPTYIEEAVKVMEMNANVKVVTANAEFFGNKIGDWNLPEFSLELLARKNMLPACSVFYKKDWEASGGYNEKLKGREDWDFWISILKNGGDVVKLPLVGFKYRIRENSKRIRTRKYKQEINNLLNERHPDFFKKYLLGPLRIQRGLSKKYNRLLMLLGMLR